MAKNSDSSFGAFVVGALVGAAFALTESDHVAMRVTRTDWARIGDRDRAVKLRSYSRSVYATVRDTPRSLENQRSQCLKAARLAREANRISPSTVGLGAVYALEGMCRDLNRHGGFLPIRVGAVDIS